MGSGVLSQVGSQATGNNQYFNERRKEQKNNEQFNIASTYNLKDQSLLSNGINYNFPGQNSGFQKVKSLNSKK
jgi:hypothetical protein|tara:strand:- start:95 stop:313 length:219 start_codon:yes stop_codon:yes gene_type:complete